MVLLKNAKDSGVLTIKHRNDCISQTCLRFLILSQKPGKEGRVDSLISLYSEFGSIYSIVNVFISHLRVNAGLKI